MLSPENIRAVQALDEAGSYDDAAAALHCSRKNVERRVQAAREYCRDKLLVHEDGTWRRTALYDELKPHFDALLAQMQQIERVRNDWVKGPQPVLEPRS
ncbi:LysR family transcriptional regulator [Promicromonospora sp. NPDC023805]|uniref:helix-turn-helix domain-containing protein n=1 Tax=Promicromonospora sp. NPDC023805 TaxID=3154696 RepID=UPI0033D5F4D0